MSDIDSESKLTPNYHKTTDSTTLALKFPFHSFFHQLSTTKTDLPGALRKRFYELLIKLHLEAFVMARTLTKKEFVIPLTEKLFNNQIENHVTLVRNGQFPSHTELVSVRPSIISEAEVQIEAHKQLLIPPKFNLQNLKKFAIDAFTESVKLCITHVRDPIGGSNSFLLVPIIKLMNQLTIIDIFSEQELHLFMTLLEPHKFSNESKLASSDFERSVL